MKTLVSVACAAFALTSASANPLSDADREALLENLEKLHEAAAASADGKYRVALAAYRGAMTSNEKAMELYLNCVEKVNFSDQQRKAQDFREWKRREAERLSDPALPGALRYQLSWLVLTLQAASDKPDMDRLASEAQSIVDSIFRDAEKLATQEQLLGQSVIGSVFARAYEINSVKVENWPLAPAQLEQVYDQLLLPPLRRPDQIEALRATWMRRILQEGAKREFWGNREGRNGGAGPRAQEYERFVAEIVPQMYWTMEKDLFNSGDQSGAAVRMLALIEKNLSHPNARQWGEEFKNLLTPKAPEVAPATADVNS